MSRMKVGFVLFGLVIISMLLWKAGLVPESMLAWKAGGARTDQIAGMKSPVPDGQSLSSSLLSGSTTFKSLQTSVNGLLLAQLSGGETGQITRMNLVVRHSLGNEITMLKFNRGVGVDTAVALNEVGKFSQLSHNGWPAGYSLQIDIDGTYVEKDGPGAAVACALLVEAAITGKKWDPTFAVTGDMNADGSVQPIGYVASKIRGAMKGPCKIVGVPVKNENAVADLLVTDGPAALVAVNVFSLSKFSDVLLLADPERPVALQTALINFDNMRTVMLRNPQQLLSLLRTPHAAQRLQALYAVAPNCLSAKYLMLYLKGNAPRNLSISGSIEAAQSSTKILASAINHDLEGFSNLEGDELGRSLSKLRRLRPILDQRMCPYVDHLIAFAEIIRDSINNPPTRRSARYNDMVSRAGAASDGARAAYDKLMNDPQVREELGK